MLPSPSHFLSRSKPAQLFRWIALVVALAIALTPPAFRAQSAPALPSTLGEKLSGGSIVLAQAIRGHRVVLVGSFSRDSASASNEWIRTLHTDPAFISFVPYQLVMLQKAPGWIRGLIRGSLRKQTDPAWQGFTISLTQDEQAWRTWFGVVNDREPYVIALDAAGHVVWSGHGACASATASLKAALH